LSVTLFEKTDMYQLLTENTIAAQSPSTLNQLNLFNI